MPEENTCPGWTMKEWLEKQEHVEGEPCRPCLLGPVAQWYYSELMENDKGQLADRLEAVVEQGESVEIASLLDSIKDEVSPDLAERLKEFDCAAQTFREDA